MIKCLHISGNCYPSIDKVNFTKSIWKELAKDFDEYHIIGRSLKNRFETHAEGNIVLHLVPALGRRSISFIITSFYLFLLIKRHEINRLLAQDAILGGFTGVLASYFYKIPIMVEIHGDIYFKFFKEKGVKDFFLSKISKFVFKRATKVRSLSSRMTELLNENEIRDNLVVIPNRVNTELFNSYKTSYELHEPIRLISIGRFVMQKGYDIAIKAVKELSSKYKLELYLVGGGPLLSVLQKLKGGCTNIHLIEWMDQEKLVTLMAQSDIYIQPSKPYLGEAMPRTILEAMAMKLPIISTNIAAIPGVIEHNRNGILINPDNTAELVKAIQKLIADQDSRSKLGQKAFLDAKEKFEWNRMFSKYRFELRTMTYENT